MVSLFQNFPRRVSYLEMLVSLGTFQYELGERRINWNMESGIKGFEIAHPLLSQKLLIHMILPNPET